MLTSCGFGNQKCGWISKSLKNPPGALKKTPKTSLECNYDSTCQVVPSLKRDVIFQFPFLQVLLLLLTLSFRDGIYLNDYTPKTNIKLDHTLARKNDSPTWCGVIVVVWCYCGGVVLLWWCGVTVVVWCYCGSVFVVV